MKKMKTLTQKDFNWIKFSLKQLEKKADEVLQNRKESLKNIKKITVEKRTFKNTVFALEKSGREVSVFFAKIEILLNMSPKKLIREKCAELEVSMSEELIEIEFDKGIFNALLEYKKNIESEKLSEIEKKLFKDYLKDYTRMGFSLSEKKQKDLKKINKRISKLSSDFSVNINNYSDNILLGKTETDGLSEIFLKTLKKEKGKFVVSLNYPEMVPFMETSENDEKRKELSEKASKKGGRKNLEILSEVLNLKEKRAKMLGYKNHADFVVEDRMVKNGKNIENFFEPLLKKIQDTGKSDLKMLEKFKREKTGDKKVKLFSHDIAFYSNTLQKEKYNVDEQKIKEYFQLDIVKSEMIKIFGELFGFVMKKNNKVKLWHKDVDFYDVFSDGKKISHIAFDLHPRSGKFGHAAMFHAEEFFQIDLGKNKFQAPMATIVCNFGKKVGKTPALMTITEVETLFHEFGHSIHHVLTKSKFDSYSGTSVAWDFVETPSQLLENWFWDKKVLKKISKHYKTGESLNEKEIENLIKSKSFLEPYMKFRQLLLTKLDFDLHTKKIKNPEIYWQKLSKKYFGIEQYKDSLFPAGFGHIIGGYDAGYYSYLWALSIADDIFSKFKEKGIFDKNLGKKYRKEILEVGGERDEKKSVEKFLGREISEKAFLKKMGIK